MCRTLPWPTVGYRTVLCFYQYLQPTWRTFFIEVESHRSTGGLVPAFSMGGVDKVPRTENILGHPAYLNVSYLWMHAYMLRTTKSATVCYFCTGSSLRNLDTSHCAINALQLVITLSGIEAARQTASYFLALEPCSQFGGNWGSVCAQFYVGGIYSRTPRPQKLCSIPEIFV